LVTGISRDSSRFVIASSIQQQKRNSSSSSRALLGQRQMTARGIYY
jgi:hypothetical protein